jgi:hypothetical protein
MDAALQTEQPSMIIVMRNSPCISSIGDVMVRVYCTRDRRIEGTKSHQQGFSTTLTVKVVFYGRVKQEFFSEWKSKGAADMDMFNASLISAVRMVGTWRYGGSIRTAGRPHLRLISGWLPQ